jgi:hypothetical protein
MNDTVQEQIQETLYARAESAYAAQERSRLLGRFSSWSDHELHVTACTEGGGVLALDACKALELRRSRRGEL